MAPGASKTEVLGNQFTNFTKPVFVPKEDQHQKLLEAVQSLASYIEGMSGRETLQPKEIAEICANLRNILSLLSVNQPPSQSPLLDQLLSELQKLKSSTPPLLSTQDQWRRLAGIEENLVHVIANIGYDILAAVQDVHSKIAVSAEAHQPAEPLESPRTFAVDPKYSKQQSIIKYMQFLQQIPGCEGRCLCSSSLESTNLKAPTHPCQNAVQLDQQIHFASPVPLYEVCPIEVLFKNFESENAIEVVINFAAAASYTNFVTSIFVPNSNGPVPVQIPWMSNMQNVQVVGKVTAEIQFSKASVPTTFPMNVIDGTDLGNRVIIFGRDFVDKYVQSVRHDSKILFLKDPVEAEKTFEKRFVYLANVLRDVETTFCRYRLKKEVKHVEDVQARIDRLQRVLVHHPPTPDEIEEPKSSTAEQNAEKSNLNPNSELCIEIDTSKPSDDMPEDFLSSSHPSSNAQQQQFFVQESSSKDVVKENPISISPARIFGKEDVCSMVSVDEQEEDLKQGFQPKIKSPEKMDQEFEKKSVEMESEVDEEVESKYFPQAGNFDETLMVSTYARRMAYRSRCLKFDERKPSYFHQVSEEATLNRPKVENAEKVALDPTRTKPPVVRKKENPELMKVDSSVQPGKNEALDKNWKLLPTRNVEKEEMKSSVQPGNGDQRTENLTVTVRNSSSQCLRKVVVKEKCELPSEPEKQKPDPVCQYVDKKDNSKRLVLVPTSVVKKQLTQENPTAKSGNKELIRKPVKLDDKSSNVDKGYKTNV